MLAVVALTCGLVVPERAPAGFSAQEIFGLLGSLLTGEDDQLVRSAVLQAAIRQASSDLPRMAALIQELVADLAVDERDLVVREFTGLYVAQRRELGRRSSAGKLPEPDSYEVFDGTSFPLWLRGRRPPTTLEEVLTAWLQDPWRPAAIQIALACFESFAATPLERRERELREEAERQEELRFQDVQQGSAPAHRIRLRALSLGARLAVMAAVPWSSHRRAILHAALPEYLSRLPDDGKARWIPLKEVWNRGKPRWEKLKDPGALAKLLAMPKTQEHPLLERLKESADPSGEKLSGQLARAAWIHMWRWPLGAGLVLAMLGLLAVVGG